MKVVNPNDATHVIKLIPRFYIEVATLKLYNEVTRIETDIANVISTIDGITSVTFDFTFAENDKFQIKIEDAGIIIYRGKLMATSQNPQKYKLSNNLYYYE
jgi:hypothetical protein